MVFFVTIVVLWAISLLVSGICCYRAAAKKYRNAGAGNAGLSQSIEQYNTTAESAVTTGTEACQKVQDIINSVRRNHDRAGGDNNNKGDN